MRSSAGLRPSSPSRCRGSGLRASPYPDRKPCVHLVLRRGASSNLLASVRVRAEVQLAATPIGYVRVELGGGEIRMPEHLLDGAEVGSPLEEVRREGMAEEMGVDALGLEAERVHPHLLRHFFP